MTAASTKQWTELFGHLRPWDDDFNESNFPLVDDPGDEVEEYGFDRPVVTGREALAEFASLGRKPASFWAHGRHIKTSFSHERTHSLVGIGTQWQYAGDGSVWFPVYLWDHGELCVTLHSLDDRFSPDCRFLIRK